MQRRTRTLQKHRAFVNASVVATVHSYTREGIQFFYFSLSLFLFSFRCLSRFDLTDFQLPGSQLRVNMLRASAGKDSLRVLLSQLRASNAAVRLLASTRNASDRSGSLDTYDQGAVHFHASKLSKFRRSFHASAAGLQPRYRPGREHGNGGFSEESNEGERLQRVSVKISTENASAASISESSSRMSLHGPSEEKIDDIDEEKYEEDYGDFFQAGRHSLGTLALPATLRKSMALLLTGTFESFGSCAFLGIYLCALARAFQRCMYYVCSRKPSSHLSEFFKTHARVRACTFL